MPKREHRLPDRNYASIAVDCRLVNGTITNLPLPADCNAHPAMASDIMMLSGCRCTGSSARVSHVMHGNNVIMTEDGGSPIIGTMTDLCGGIEPPFVFQAPTTAPAVSSSLGDCPHYTAYMYTNLYAIGDKVYESQPSPASDMVGIGDNPVVLDGMVEPADMRFIGFVIYRAEAGYKQGQEKETDTVASWVWVDISDATTYTDTFDSGMMKPSSPYLFERGQCPSNLQSIGMTDSGVYFGLSGNELWYTYPGEPDTFHPRRRRQLLSEWGDPVHAVATGDTIYVFTNICLVVYKTRLAENGVSLNPTVLRNLPLASIASVAVSHAGVLFSSTASLFLASGDSVVDVGGRWWNPNEYRDLNPEKIMGAVHQNAYLMANGNKAYLLTFGDGIYEAEEYGDLVELNMEGRFSGITALRGDTTGFYFARGKYAVVAKWSHTDDSTGLHDRFVYRTVVNDNDHSQTFTAMEIHVKKPSAMSFRYYRTDADCGDKLIRDCYISKSSILSIKTNRREEDSAMEVEGSGTVLSVNCATSKFALRRDSNASNE